MEKLRTAKREAARASRDKAAAEAAARAKSNSGGRLGGVAEEGIINGEFEDNPSNAMAPGIRDVPEWIQQQLPSLLRLLEAARLLVQVSFAVGMDLTASVGVHVVNY